MRTILFIFFYFVILSAAGQRIYLSGNLSAYSYGHQYKGQFPFQESYTTPKPGTNNQLGLGISFYDQHFAELSVSKIDYWFHTPLFYTTVDDRKALNFNFTYKYGLLRSRHFNKKRNFQFSVLSGFSIQHNPKKTLDFGMQSASVVINDDSISLSFDRTQNSKLLLRFGVEFEKKIFIDFYLHGSVVQYVGFTPQMTTYSQLYHKGAYESEGRQIANGTGRNFSLGVRYYINNKKLIARGLDSSRIGKGYWYLGFDIGTYRNEQSHYGSNTFPYTLVVTSKNILTGASIKKGADQNFQGLFFGYRRKNNFYEFGFYIRPDNIGYTFEPGPSHTSINYTSQSYLYLPVRFKQSLFSYKKASRVLEFVPSIGLASNIHLPNSVRSDEITFNSPQQSFSQKSFLLTGELGAELHWNYGRFSAVAYTRLLIGFQNSRRVEFTKTVNVIQTEGSSTSNPTGLWNGFNLKFRI